MQFLKNRRMWIVTSVIGYALIALVITAVQGANAAQPSQPEVPPGVAAVGIPTYSSPIVLSDNGSLVWTVNPDDDSISIINAATDAVILKVRVGDEPQGIAVDEVNHFAYVVNAADNSVSIIQYTPNLPNVDNTEVVNTFTTGAEPWNVVISPDAQRVFVANSAQDTITVLDTATRQIVGNINLTGTACVEANRHFQPRGMAITGDSTLLYVTRFLSFTGGATPQQGSDTGKEGVVCRMTIDTSATGNTIASGFSRLALAPTDTGFTAQIGNPPVATATSAYPNQMQSIVICGDRAYMPNIASSPAGPLRFNVDTHAYVNMLSGVNGATPQDAGALNLHLGARANEPKIFFANVWAMACDNPVNPTKAYVVSAGSDGLVKVNVEGNGALTFTGANPANQTTFIDLNPNDPEQEATFGRKAGKNPLGIVIRAAAGGQPTKAYVMNFVSRNVSIVNLDTDTPITALNTTNLPDPGSRDEELLVGAEIFFSSRGHFDRPLGTIVSTSNRLSSEGWQNCASCHFAGLTDGNVWAFGAGPRKSVPLNGTWSPHNADDQRILNYSAIFDEVEDFELNIRNVSGPGNVNPPVDNSVFNKNQGLLVTDTGDLNFAPTVINSLGAKANAGRPQHTVTLPNSSTSWPALTAMKQWVRFAVRTPNGALTTDELTADLPELRREGNPETIGGINASQVRAGRRAFLKAGCATCHGGTKWTVSSKDFASPPAGAEIATEINPAPPAGVTPINTPYLPRFLRDIGSFNLNVPGKGNTLPGAAEIGAFERAAANGVTGDAGPLALGIDHNGDGKGTGYNIPSLLGIWQLQPYYHNGACETLACVLSNQTHAKAGKPGQSNLSATEQANIVAFLKTLDAETAFPTNLSVRDHDIFIDPPTVFRGAQVQVGANISLFGTKPDLVNLINDLGAGSTLKVRFSGPGTFSPAEVTLDPATFNQDFGQAVISTTWTVPNDTGSVRIKVEIDSGDVLPEDKEGDNDADRRVRVSNPPPDRTPPEVSSVAISDNNPFDDNDAITTSRNVKVKIQASDSGTAASGLESFCIVRYSYDSRQRRWVEERCDFRSLPEPEAGTTDTFIVDTSLSPRQGTAYTFVWVKDADGNISREPGFDVISFIPAGEIELDRNEVRIFRITLAPGSTPINFTFNVEEGDVDVSVFDNINANAQRIDLSANNGDEDEQVTVANTTNETKIFQIEVRAVVNSEFTINFGPGALLAEEIAPAKSLPPSDGQQIIVGGPPARTSAIGEPTDVLLPIVIKP